MPTQGSNPVAVVVAVVAIVAVATAVFGAVDIVGTVVVGSSRPDACATKLVCPTSIVGVVATIGGALLAAVFVWPLPWPCGLLPWPCGLPL